VVVAATTVVEAMGHRGVALALALVQALRRQSPHFQ
jgi:hypothetical protein